ncbi:MAG: hypothetical protein ACRDD1_21295, partial [Planctomycetia bacterium]
MKRVIERNECWLCHGNFDEAYWTDPDAVRDYNFRYVRCSSCGLVSVSPYLLDASLGLNEDEHHNYVNSAAEYIRTVSPDAFRFLWGKVENYRAGFGSYGGGRLLEVGAAVGFLMDVARARDWDVAGIEPSEPCASWGREFL